MAYMIETMPSMTKKAISTSVSDIAPLSGQSNNTTPAPMPIIAEISDHQNPGVYLAQNVVIRPMMPLTRKIQPMMMGKATVAIGGKMMAAKARMTRKSPSAKNRPQWA